MSNQRIDFVETDTALPGRAISWLGDLGALVSNGETILMWTPAEMVAAARPRRG
jgi:hypothetical protein